MYPKPLQDAIEQLRKLPGVGQKTAERYAFALLNYNAQEIKDFSEAILKAKTTQSFENANYPQAVARPTEGLTADYQLLIDIRSFQVELLPEPSADVEFSAKILAGDGRLVGSHIVHASVPVQATDAAAAAAGLNEAFGRAATELVIWASGLI